MTKSVKDVTMRSGGLTVAFSDSSIAEVVYVWDRKTSNFIPSGISDSDKMLVEAFFEFHSSFDGIEDISGLDNQDNNLLSISNLGALLTNNKTNIVEAVNELVNNIGPLDDLNTITKESLVKSINEVFAKAKEALQSSQAFTFIQSDAATPWTITHNLGYRPCTAIFSKFGKEVLAEVTHPSANQILVYFDLPMSGSATLS